MKRIEQGSDTQNSDASSGKRASVPLMWRFLFLLTAILATVTAFVIGLHLSDERHGVEEAQAKYLEWVAERLTSPLREHRSVGELRGLLAAYADAGVVDALWLGGPDNQRIGVGKQDPAQTWINVPMAVEGWSLFGRARNGAHTGETSNLIPAYLLLFLLAAGLIGWITRRYFAAPLRQLTQSVERIGSGKSSGPLVVSGSNEFRMLASFINRLLSHCDGQRDYLQQALVSVRDSRERLEQTVRERTESLEKTARALRRREVLLQEYAEVTSQHIDLRGRIRELMRLACRMLSLHYGLIINAREGALNVIERYPLGRNLPLPDIVFVADVLRAEGPLVRSGSQDSEHPNILSEAAPAAFVALPLEVFGRRNFVLLIASDVTAPAPFSREDISLLALFRDWISATLTNEAQERLIFRQKERAQVTLESITEAVITTDKHGIVDYMNPVAEMLTGRLEAEARGLPAADLLHLLRESSREAIENPVMRCLRMQKVVVLAEDLLLRSEKGKEYAVEGSFAPIRDRRGDLSGTVTILHDVSQAREMATRLSYHATHDALTGLCNRREFEGRLKTALDSARGGKHTHALLYMDLDQFKIVNDTSGHTAGDNLLKQIADELQRHIDEDDTLARLGGDEFGVLLLDCDVSHAQLVADRLLQAVKAFRFAWRHRTFDVGMSIGLVPIGRGCGHLSQLMSAADTACYAAKNEGRNRVHLYQVDDAAVTEHRGMMEWAVTINTALQLNRFVLFRQPIQPLSAPARKRHYEILLRLRREDGSLVEPGHFIPAAERFDMMPAVDRWVIRSVCRYLASQPEEARDAIDYSINLSGASVDDETLLEFITNIFIEFDINPATICFEITETAAISSLHRAIELVRELRSIGCKFSLDDFGAGFSSFSYLKNFPLDYLKIDGAFISGIIDDPVDQAMVKAINDVGHTMGIETIAEYVESEEIAMLLRTVGVDYAQGFWIARPERLVLGERVSTLEAKEILLKSGR